MAIFVGEHYSVDEVVTVGVDFYVPQAQKVVLAVKRLIKVPTRLKLQLRQVYAAYICVCVCIYIYVCVCVCVYIYIYIYIYIC